MKRQSNTSMVNLDSIEDRRNCKHCFIDVGNDYIDRHECTLCGTKGVKEYGSGFSISTKGKWKTYSYKEMYDLGWSI